jgi:hypothetical protein
VESFSNLSLLFLALPLVVWICMELLFIASSACLVSFFFWSQVLSQTPAVQTTQLFGIHMQQNGQFSKPFFNLQRNADQ